MHICIYVYIWRVHTYVCSTHLKILSCTDDFIVWHNIGIPPHECEYHCMSTPRVYVQSLYAQLFIVVFTSVHLDNHA